MMKHPLIALALLLLIPGTFASIRAWQPASPALDEMVASERAFARMSVARGVRESFAAFFADDGVNFQPHPVNFKEDLRKRPAPATPPQAVLNWSPICGDVSQAGDLGYDTGPFTVEDLSPQKRPTQHGLFFSVWKKQPDGNWKVVLDIGVSTPAAVAPLDAPFQPAAATTPHSGGQTPKSEDEDPRSLLEAERGFLEMSAGGSGEAYRKRIAPQIRIHRNGSMPVVGEDAVSKWAAQQNAPLSGEPMHAAVARSGDLGYVYGSYQIEGNAGEKGYYTRVWKRDDRGQWKIVADVTNPIPAQ